MTRLAQEDIDYYLDHAEEIENIINFKPITQENIKVKPENYCKSEKAMKSLAYQKIEEIAKQTGFDKKKWEEFEEKKWEQMKNQLYGYFNIRHSSEQCQIIFDPADIDYGQKSVGHVASYGNVKITKYIDDRKASREYKCLPLSRNPLHYLCMMKAYQMIAFYAAYTDPILVHAWYEPDALGFTPLDYFFIYAEDDFPFQFTYPRDVIDPDDPLQQGVLAKRVHELCTNTKSPLYAREALVHGSEIKYIFEQAVGKFRATLEIYKPYELPRDPKDVEKIIIGTKSLRLQNNNFKEPELLRDLVSFKMICDAEEMGDKIHDLSIALTKIFEMVKPDQCKFNETGTGVCFQDTDVGKVVLKRYSWLKDFYDCYKQSKMVTFK